MSIRNFLRSGNYTRNTTFNTYFTTTYSTSASVTSTSHTTTYTTTYSTVYSTSHSTSQQTSNLTYSYVSTSFNTSHVTSQGTSAPASTNTTFSTSHTTSTSYTTTFNTSHSTTYTTSYIQTLYSINNLNSLAWQGNWIAGQIATVTGSSPVFVNTGNQIPDYRLIQIATVFPNGIPDSYYVLANGKYRGTLLSGSLTGNTNGSGQYTADVSHNYVVGTDFYQVNTSHTTTYSTSTGTSHNTTTTYNTSRSTSWTTFFNTSYSTTYSTSRNTGTTFFNTFYNTSITTTYNTSNSTSTNTSHTTTYNTSPSPFNTSHLTSLLTTRLTLSPFYTPRTAYILMFGQSNIANYGAIGQAEMYNPVDYVRHLDINNTFVNAISYVNGSTHLASGVYGNLDGRIGSNLINDSTYDRVFVVNVAVGGTKIAWWASTAGSTDYTKRDDDIFTYSGVPSGYGKLYQRLQHAATQASTYGFNFTHVLICIGESDNIDNTTKAAWKSSFSQVQTDLINLGITAPIFLSKTSYYLGVTDSNITDAQTEVVSENSNVFAGPNTDNYGSSYRTDDAHFTIAGMDIIGQKWVDSILARSDSFS